jgi:putative heme-binding domain-containing protein
MKSYCFRSLASLTLAALVYLPATVRGADHLSALAAVLVESNDPAVQLDILRGISAGLRGQQRLAMPAGWAAVETRLGGSPNSDIRTLVQTLSLTFGSESAMQALRGTAGNAQAAPEARRTALDSLLAARDPGLVGLLQGLISDPVVRPQAIRQLASFDDPKTPGLVLGQYAKLSVGERRDALNTLASRVAYARPLLEAVAAGQVARTDLTAELIRQLRNLKNEEVNRRITAVWGVMQDTSPDMAKEVEKFKALYWKGGSTPGDASRGRVVFNQVCAQCHRLFDAGGAVGPDITGANRSDLDYLLQNILYPNAVIPNEYRQTLIELKDGRVVSGIVKGKEGNTLLVQTANALERIAEAEVVKQEQAENSMMPEGLIAQLPEVQIRDLLYYLGRPGQVPLPEK